MGDLVVFHPNLSRISIFPRYNGNPPEELAVMSMKSLLRACSIARASTRAQPLHVTLHVDEDLWDVMALWQPLRDAVLFPLSEVLVFNEF